MARTAAGEPQRPLGVPSCYALWGPPLRSLGVLPASMTRGSLRSRSSGTPLSLFSPPRGSRCCSTLRESTCPRSLGSPTGCAVLSLPAVLNGEGDDIVGVKRKTISWVVEEELRLSCCSCCPPSFNRRSVVPSLSLSGSLSAVASFGSRAAITGAGLPSCCLLFIGERSALLLAYPSSQRNSSLSLTLPSCY